MASSKRAITFLFIMEKQIIYAYILYESLKKGGIFMDIQKTLKSTSLIIEIESGKDSSGNATYKKKTFSNVKETSTPQDLFEVARAIEACLAVSTRDFYMTETSYLRDYDPNPDDNKPAEDNPDDNQNS